MATTDYRRAKNDAAREARSSGGPDAAFAALDLGTNNCRLLIARPDGENFSVIDAFSRAVRLGEGVERSNQLAEEAQLRALKALRICASKIRQHRAADARIVATEACRRAANGAGFVRRVAREIGLQMEIISAEEEARLAVAGCAPLIDPDCEQLLVFDIGGGSTELIWIDMSPVPAARRPSLIRALAPCGPGQEQTDRARAAAAHIADWVSVPMGVSTLYERFSGLGNDAMKFAAMSQHFAQHLVGFGSVRSTSRLQIIGVSGTATTFGALHLGLRNYDRALVDGLWLPTLAAQSLAEELLSMGPARTNHPGIGPNRAKLILSGAAILMTILQLWPVAQFRIADRGLREGMLYGLLHQRQPASQ